MNFKYFIATVFLILFLFPITSATTTYSCCNALETSSGTILNNMDNITQWVLQGGVGTETNDTINKTEGTQSIRLSSTATQSIDWTLDTPILFSELNKVSVWIYTENSSNTSGIDFYFSNNTNFHNYMFVEIPQTALKVNEYSNPSYPAGNFGWKKFSFATINGTNGTLSEGHSVYGVYGGLNQTDTIKLIRIRNVPKSSRMSNISIDNLRYGYTGKAKAIIVFDDEYYNASTFTIVKNTLIANNQKATMYVRTDHVGISPSDLTANNQSGYMNISLLKELELAGWDISSHTNNHTHLETDNATTLDNELKSSQQWLINNGFSVRGSELLAYPFGTYNQDAIIASKQYYLMARSTDNGIFQPLLSLSDYRIDNQSYHQGWQQVNSQNADNITTNRINDTIVRGGIIVLGYHAISPNNTAQQSIEVNLSTFINVSNYLASRSSDIDVISMSDLLIVTTTTTESTSWSVIRNTTGIDLTGLIVIAFLAILVVLVVMGTDLSYLETTEIVIGAIVIIVIVFLISIVLGSLSTQF